MASRSQASYVAKLAKAEQLHQYLLSFNDYTPGDSTLTTAALETRIASLHTLQNEYTQTQHNYLLATEQRRQHFEKEPNSIGKLLSPIGSYVKAKMKKDSRVYQEVSTLVQKIRGSKKKTLNNGNEDNNISHSEKSYGSQLQNFQDIITLLTELATDYQPANEAIKLEALQALYASALDKNNEVSKTISIFKPNIDTRQQAYKELAQIANSIKNMVKSQYGINSTEYILIKGLVF